MNHGRARLALALGFALLSLGLPGAQERPLPDQATFLAETRKHLQTDTSVQGSYMYVETQREVKLDKNGRTQEQSVKVYESYPGLPGEPRWERLISENGRPVSREELSPGLVESETLEQPIFSPATKAETGHDEDITIARVREILGDDVAERLESMARTVYNFGERIARHQGIIIADTKFEFGLLQGRLVLIDEVLTPDSSRFWPADQYQPGKSQPSFDKQFVRDYLETLDWDKTPPGPTLPADVVAKTTAKYLEAYERLTERKL